jgi:hypothetical protein
MLQIHAIAGGMIPTLQRAKSAECRLSRLVASIRVSSASKSLAPPFDQAT